MRACILPIFLYKCEVWSVTSTLSKTTGAVAPQANPPYSLHGRILSQTMRFSLALDNTSCLTLSVDVACLFSDTPVVPMPVKTIPELFRRAFRVLPKTAWPRRIGRPRQSWLRTLKDDLRPPSFGLATARRHALNRSAWRLLVETSTSTQHAPDRVGERDGESR